MIPIPAKPYPYPLDPAHTALVVIDMQRDFIERGGFGDSLGNDVARLEAIIPATAALIQLFRQHRWPVIHTREAHKPDLSDCPPSKIRRGNPTLHIGEPGAMGRLLVAGEPGNQIVDALAPIAGEIVIDKPGKGMFWATGIHECLQGLGITHLVFAGVTTEVCVQTSMREANDRGYECLLIEDATESYFAEFKAATVKMIVAQGGIVGWVTPLSALSAAVTRSIRMTEQGRWAGRSPDKDVIRHEIWHSLEVTETAVGPAWSMIPNFVGADTAAWHLAQTDEWKRAKTVKTNPDAPQIPIRLRALYQGKLVFAPVPYLTAEFPYLRLDPEKLKKKGISFELAATAQGFVEHGDRIEFDEVAPLDFCVCGSVAVTRAGGRTGKGAGFADLETAIFRELGIVSATTPMATTVHSSQLVEDSRVPMKSHDSPLDFVATERELIRTHNTAPRPMGVDWDHVRPDQFETIPFLTRLRDKMLARRSA